MAENREITIDVMQDEKKNEKKTITIHDAKSLSQKEWSAVISNIHNR